MKPLAIVGLSICGAVIALVLVLGLTPVGPVAAVAGGVERACGAVLNKEELAKILHWCDEAFSARTTLMLAIGFPGLILGVGMFIAGRRDEANA